MSSWQNGRFDDSRGHVRLSCHPLLQEEKSPPWKRVPVNKSFWKGRSIVNQGRKNRTKQQNPSCQHAENPSPLWVPWVPPMDSSPILNTPWAHPRNVKISGANSEMPPPCRFIFAVAWAICNTKLASIIMFTWSIQEKSQSFYIIYIYMYKYVYKSIYTYIVRACMYCVMCIYIYVYTYIYLYMTCIYIHIHVHQSDVQVVEFSSLSFSGSYHMLI